MAFKMKCVRHSMAPARGAFEVQCVWLPKSLVLAPPLQKMHRMPNHPDVLYWMPRKVARDTDLHRTSRFRTGSGVTLSWQQEALIRREHSTHYC
jgi:hypothetical protein